MTVELKYYSYTDPESGQTAKDIGWTGTVSSSSVVVQVQDGVPVVLKDETTEQPVSRIPAGQDLREISKDEFDKIDISGASDKAKKRHDRAQKAAAKLVSVSGEIAASPAEALVTAIADMPQVQEQARQAGAAAAAEGRVSPHPSPRALPPQRS